MLFFAGFRWLAPPALDVSGFQPLHKAHHHMALAALRIT